MSRLRVFVPCLALTLLVAACGGGQSQPSSPGGSGASTASTAPAAGAVEIKVSVAGGKVQPPSSVHKVATGKTVRLVVTSDKEDEVHVHGYDKEAKLPAGKPTTIEFVANQGGRFEVETHESGLQLLQLEVS